MPSRFKISRMAAPEIFFWSALAFMAGAALVAFLSPAAVIFLGFLGAALFLFLAVLKNRLTFRYAAVFCLFIIAGSFYYNFYSNSENYLRSIFAGDLFNQAAVFLQEFKNKIEANIEDVLDPQKAAFLNGLILGERQRFSKEFKDDLNKSGTTHLVALSGYNIAIIVLSVKAFLGNFLGPRKVFIFTLFAVIAFVAMTGAASSAVRAAIMAGLVLLAERGRRLYDSRQAVVSAAFFMTLANPKVIVFDWGFQFSFAAVLGLIYIRPALQKIFSAEQGFLSWRENLITTSAAQISVLPLLIWHFGYFSPLSLMANILVLEAIPLTMFMGFLIGGLGFFSSGLSLMAGWFASLLLGYEIFVIKFFADLSRLLF